MSCFGHLPCALQVHADAYEDLDQEELLYIEDVIFNRCHDAIPRLQSYCASQDPASLQAHASDNPNRKGTRARPSSADALVSDPDNKRAKSNKSDLHAAAGTDLSSAACQDATEHSNSKNCGPKPSREVVFDKKKIQAASQPVIEPPPSDDEEALLRQFRLETTDITDARDLDAALLRKAAHTAVGNARRFNKQALQGEQQGEWWCASTTTLSEHALCWQISM